MLDTLFTWPTVAVSLLTLVIASSCVMLHHDALSWLHKRLPKMHGPRQQRVLRIIFAILALHSAEIFLFALGYLALLQDPQYGSLVGIGSVGIVECGYFSAVVYTTLGLGDIVPQGAIRIMVGPQALLGFVLITWSASFTFIEMQRYWNDRRD